MSPTDPDVPNTEPPPSRRSGEDGGPATKYWSFGSGKSHVWPRWLSEAPHPQEDEDNPGSANTEPDATSALQKQSAKPPRAVIPPLVRLGRRALTPIGQWEGVVEEVNGSGFKARIVALGNGHVSNGHAEFTEFDFDDLAHPSEREMIREGAVFYWTIGRMRNASGTVQNTSLVRLRRVPKPSRRQLAMAEEEARSLMGDGEPDG